MKGSTDNAKFEGFADALDSLDCVGLVRVNSHEVQADIDMPNADWGLPSDIHTAMEDRRMCIDDFSHVSSDSIRVYFSGRS